MTKKSVQKGTHVGTRYDLCYRARIRITNAKTILEKIVKEIDLWSGWSGWPLVYQQQLS